MGKARMIGALSLAMGLVVMSPSLCQAQTTKQISDQNNQGKSLTALVEEAKAAWVYVSENPSKKYPGLEKYLQNLIKQAEAEEIENEVELMRALDEVIVAVPLLVPEKTVARTDSQPTKATNGISPKAELEAKVTQNVSESEPSEPNLDSNEAELPKTGEARTVGVGGLILAGAAVMIGTLGATILILRSKKRA